MVILASKSLTLVSQHLLKEEMVMDFAKQDLEPKLTWLLKFISNSPTKARLLTFSLLE